MVVTEQGETPGLFSSRNEMLDLGLEVVSVPFF